MADPLTPTVSDRICRHMNEDHTEAVVLYARVYGNISEAETAQMLSIDAQGMNLSVQVNDSNSSIRIEFDHQLQDSEDAHHTLINMLKQANR